MVDEESLSSPPVGLKNFPVYLVGYNETSVFFKFKRNDDENDYQTGFARVHNLFNEQGKRLKKCKTSVLAKVDDFFKDFPIGIGVKACQAEIVPLLEDKKEDSYVTSTGIEMKPLWYARFIWLGDPLLSLPSSSSSTTKAAVNADQDKLINGNPLDLDIEKLSNVPGKYFKRKKWRCRNGLGFVKFIYEGQVAVSRICGRDFFINSQPGSLPHLVSNEEIDITMEVRRLKKPGLWPQLEHVNADNVDDLISTEFVSPAAWTGPRPTETMLDKHLDKAELDMFRLPKDFVARIQDQQVDALDVIMNEDYANEDEKKHALGKDCFPLPKEATFYNQAAILIKFVSNFLIQLELRSSPTTEENLVGKKLYASRNR